MIRKAIGYTASALWAAVFIVVMVPLVALASWGLYGEDV